MLLPRAAVAAPLALLLVTGCGAPQPSGSAAPDRSPAATGQGDATQSPALEAETIKIAIKEGKIDPAPGRVEVAKGTKVRVEIASDRKDEAHLHGYDLSARVGPGEDGVIEFTADQVGLYELETHNDGKLLTQLAVQ